MADGLVLVDTNVIVAALVEDHQHHAESLAVFTAKPGLKLVVAAHCYAEAFTTLTRRGVHAPFKRPPALAWAALESVAATTRLVGLTPAQSFAAVRDFASAGHIGAKIYDFLIARAADVAGADVLVTWNVSHFGGLIEGLAVRSPVELLAQP